MKKKILLTLTLALIFVCLFVVAVSAEEFGNVTTVDGITTVEGLDTTSRVLMSDGVTYPSAYIFSSKSKISFDALSSATGKDYTASSVVMIEYPEGCTYIERTFAASKTLKYVYFSSTITGVQWGTFLSCSNLTVVEFAENSTITAMNTDCFGGTGIVELRLPNSLQTVNENFLRSSSNLTTVSFGESFAQVFNRSAFFAGCGNLKTLYVPAGNFDENGDISIVSNFFGWNDRDSSFRNGGVIYYTGTKEQAQIIINKELKLYADKNESTAIWNTIQLVNTTEYNALTVEQKAAGCYMVYDYNKCDAFYEGEHKYGTEQEKFLGAEYLTDYVIATTCQRCNENVIKETVATAIFTNKGYSYASYGTGKSFTFGISLNEQSYSDYIAHNPDANIKFGFIIGSVESDDNQILNADGTSKLVNHIITDFTNVEYQRLNRYDLIIHGIGDDDVDTPLYCGAYVIEDDSIYYIGNTTTTKAVPITYSVLPVA